MNGSEVIKYTYAKADMIIFYLTPDESHKKGSGWGSDAPDELSQTGYDLRLLLKPIQSRDHHINNVTLV